MAQATGSPAVISENRRWRFFVFFILYVAQGIPFGLILMAIPAYLAAEGVDAAAVAGFLTVALLPHGIKLINAPIMDRWTYWPMGQRRPWVLIAQLALFVSLIGIAFIPDPLDNLALLTSGCFVVNFCYAFLDVATDGMAVDLLPVEDQAKASGLMFGGVTLSGAAFAPATGWLLSTYGLFVTALVCAFAVILISLVPLLSRERPGEKLLPWTAGEAHEARGPQDQDFRKIASNVKRFFLLRASLMLAVTIFIYGISRGIHLALMPVYFVQDLGWSDTAFSSVSGIALLIAGGFAMLFGGVLIDYVGRRRMFGIGCALAGILALSVALIPELGNSEILMTSYRVAYNTLDTLIVVAYIAIAMAISTKVIAATQFALYMAIGNVGYSLGSAIFGRLQDVLAYSQVFFVFAGVVVSTIFLMSLVSMEAHRKTVLQLQADTA